MNKNVKGVGIDAVEVQRFFPFKRSRGERFLVNNFTEKELDYCYAFRDPSAHLAGTFAAKEAIWKALGNSKMLQSAIEIRREKTGAPRVWIKNRHQKSIFVSISHTATIAMAIAIKQ